MSPRITIENRQIGDDHPVYFIAELSANHGHSIERCYQLISAAKSAGADAVKVQTYTADTITIDCDNPIFRIDSGTIWDGQRLHDLYKTAHMPWDWQPALKKYANGLGLDFFSSPFDTTAVEFLESMQVPAYKVASFELVDAPLLEAIGATGKPVIVSTGMSTRLEIGFAIETLRMSGADEIAILKCTSAYPAPPQSMNLATIADMRRTFQLPVGLSDHTLGVESAVVAVALGACIVEKHLTLRRSDGGPDSAFSLEPEEFSEMVRAARVAEQAVGKIQYGPNDEDQSNLRFRKSLFVVQDIAAGEQFTAENVRSIRPAGGLEPRYYREVLGRIAVRQLSRGTPLNWEHMR